MTSGAVALLIEWGMKQKQPHFYSGEEIRNYLIRGTEQNPTISYPNPICGYGSLNVYQMFSSISSS